ncbi:MAG: sigma-70 family RNA polymerase sigma factor, partial [Endomicrobia bacterium]|nr:sigma-70 family RNA polymerase sigma factor [Endomicrobiia bacterium]
ANKLDENLFIQFIQEIVVMFRKYAQIDTVDTDAEIFLSKVYDTLLSKLEEFAIKAQNDTNFELWFPVWLRKTIRNYAYKYKRTMKTKQELLHSELEFSNSEHNPEEIFVDISSDELSKLITEEFVEKFLNSLEDVEKEILNLKLQNFKQKEIAQKINKSEPTVTRIMQSIREKFLKIKKELYGKSE